jgi:cytosine permease
VAEGDSNGAPGAHFVVEGYARQRIPDAQLGGAQRVFFIVVGALCGLPVYVLAAQIIHGIDAHRAHLAFLIGGVVSGSLGALSAFVGARTRMNVAMLADVAFGRLGGRLVKTVIALSLIGWVGVILSVLGATATPAIESLYGWRVAPEWIAIGAALAVTAISLRGVRGLEHVGMVIAPLLLVLLAYTLFHGCAAGGATHPFVVEPLSLGAAVSAVVGEYVVGIVIQPDYGRFVRLPVRAGIASGLALGVIFPGILTLSAIPSTRCGSSDLIHAMVMIGVGLPALALLILGAWIDASACLYSGSLSLTNEFKRFTLGWVTVVSAGVGCLVAVLHAERIFIPFLTILGYTFPPIVSIHVLHTLVHGRGGGMPSAGPLPSLRISALLSWGAGSLTGFSSSRGHATLTGIAAVDAVLVAAVCWLVLEGGGLLVRRPLTARP